MQMTGGGRCDSFVCDHPFIMLITHKATGEIIFYGRVANLKMAETTKEDLWKASKPILKSYYPDEFESSSESDMASSDEKF